MLNDFLETNIQNKLHIISILHLKHSISLKELSHELDLSISGMNSMINELNFELRELAEIHKGASSLKLLKFKKNVTFTELSHVIYRNSIILQCLRYLLTNESHEPFSAFIEEKFLTKSSAYRIRQHCSNYLHNIGLSIKNNIVTGEEYRIRFLIALLYYKYGINCCDIDTESIEIARKFILSTNQHVNMNFLEHTTNEYGYFECLFILSWKRQKYNSGLSQPNSLDKLKKIFVYREMIAQIRSVVEPQLNLHFTESDYDYIYLAYCCANSCVLADKWSQEDVQQVHEIVFSDEKFTSLLTLIGEQFGEELKNSPELHSALVYFYKKCLFDLQCIIPDKHYYLGVKKDPLILMVKKQISSILDIWKEENHILYPIDKGHISYLSIQIASILRQFMTPISVFVVADSPVELEIMKLYLSRTYPENRVSIRTVLINTQDISFLQQQQNSVIIIKKSFEYITDFLKLPTDCKIIFANIDINTSDQQSILDAIISCEEKIFKNFVEQKQRKQLPAYYGTFLLRI